MCALESIKAGVRCKLHRCRTRSVRGGGEKGGGRRRRGQVRAQQANLVLALGHEQSQLGMVAGQFRLRVHRHRHCQSRGCQSARCDVAVA